MANRTTTEDRGSPIVIDYDNVDVADIMAQVSRRAAERPPAAPETGGEGPVFRPQEPPPRGLKGLVKKTVRFLARPCMPFLIPLYDRFKFRLTLATNVRIDEVATRLGTTRETVKLLHNLDHNLVLELTKLKVEHDTLKSKVRVLEKELEILGKREKVLEKRVLE
jgi:hypothetical protein